MKFLLLGGTGYVGTMIDKLLREIGHETLIVGRNTHQKFEIGEEIDESIFENVDYVFYLSWFFDTNNKNYQKLNIDSLKSVLKICNTKNIKLLFFSTYYASEESVSLYNKTKYICEKLVLASSQEVVRLGSVVSDHSKTEGFYGILINFVARYRIFLEIKPKKKAFYKTSTSDINKLIQNLSDQSKEVRVCASDNPLYLDQLLKIDSSKVLKIPVYWYFLYLIIKLSEKIGLNLQFRSDSLLSIWGEQ